MGCGYFISNVYASDTKHYTDTVENFDIIQFNHMCWCRVSVGRLWSKVSMVRYDVLCCCGYILICAWNEMGV